MSIDEIKRQPHLLETMSDEELMQYRRCYAPFQSTKWLIVLIDRELERRQ